MLRFKISDMYSDGTDKTGGGPPYDGGPTRGRGPGKHIAILRRYYSSLAEMATLWRKITDSGDYGGPDALRYKLVCEGAIARAIEVRTAFADTDGPEYAAHLTYPAFKNLALLYERRGGLDAAISVCRDALRRGFPNDGTKGGMIGRLKRLEEHLSDRE